MEKITLIIPIYNSNYIEKQLYSINNLEKKDIDLDVIYVDDGSDKEFINQYKQILHSYSNLQITYFSLGEKDGKNRVGKARNHGAQLSKGKYLIFIDQETILTQNYLSKILGQNDINAVVLGPYYGYNNLEKHLSEDDIDCFIHHGFIEKDNFKDFRIDFYKDKQKDNRIWEFFCGSNFFIQKEIFNAVGGFDEAIETWGDEDVEFGYRLHTMGHTIIFDETLEVLNVSPKLYQFPYKILEADKIYSLSENWYRNFQKHKTAKYKRYIYDRYSNLEAPLKNSVSDLFKSYFLNKKNILVHAINGIGLGHIKRTLMIARELVGCEEVGEIIFVTNSENPFLIINEGFNVKFLEYGIEDTHADISFDFYEEYTYKKLNSIIDDNAIGLILHDTYFVKSLLLQRKDIKHFLILRDSELSYLQSIASYIQSFKKVFIPHIQEEISLEKQAFYNQFNNIIFSGYIVDSVEKNYTKNKKIIVSPGYGGDYEDTKIFFEYVNTLLSNTGVVKSYEVVFILGKHAEKLKNEIVFSPVYRLEHFDENLSRSISKCSLFIGRGGYNTLNEVFLSRTKSLLFSVDRFAESQSERICFFKNNFHIDFIKLGQYKNEDDINLLTQLLENTSITNEDYSYVFSGKKVVVDAIKEDLHKVNILVFKHIFLPKSEHFIFEELTGFKNISPIIFTLKKENIDIFPSSIEIVSLPFFNELLHPDYPQVQNPELYIKFLKYVCVLVKKYKIQVIYTEFLFDAYFIYKLKSIFKEITIFSAGRGFDVYSFLPTIGMKKNDFLLNIDGVFTRDNCMKDKAINFGFSNVSVIRSVIDFKKYCFIQKDFSSFSILIGGRFVEKKNLIELLDLVKKLYDTGLVSKIGLVGDGKLFDEIQEKIEVLHLSKVVKMYGFLSHIDLLNTIKEYNCFINYSKKSSSGDDEGIPVLMLENILGGNLVFSSISGGIGELFPPTSGGALCGDVLQDFDKINSIFKNTEFIHTIIETNYNLVLSMYSNSNSLLKLENKLLLKNEK